MRLTILTKGLVLSGFILLACSDGKVHSSKITAGELNHTRSELSELMLAMHTEAAQMKKKIANGEPLSFELDYDQILTAQASDSNRTATSQYQNLAKSYLQQMDNLKSSDQIQLHENYEKMLISCISCHQAICPGPLGRIKKLQD